MSLTFGFHPLAIVLAIAAAAALTWWVYRTTTPEISQSRKLLLGGLRFVGLALVILLLAEPVIRTVTSREEQPVVAFLVDVSESLSPDVSNVGELGSVLGGLASDLSAGLEADLRFYSFGRETESLDGGELDSLVFDASRTDITSALETVRTDLRDEPLSSVVLVSDGLYNTGRNPIYASDGYPVPVHTLVVGDTTARRDIVLQRVVANDVAYVNRELPIRVTVRSDGFGGENVRVAVRSDRGELVATSIQLPEGRVEVPVDLVITPAVEGFQSFAAEVTPLDNELTASNNVANFSIRVLSRKLQVLLVAGAPSPDVGALVEILAGDSDIEVTTSAQKGYGEYYGSDVPADLSAFDAVVLAGYPGRTSDPAVVRRIGESELPLLFFLDHGTDLRKVRDELASALPVVPQRIRAGFVEANVIATAAGRSHPTMNLDRGPDNLERLPPLSYSQTSWQAAPDARTLATVTVRGIELDDPLVVVRDRAGLRSAAILGAGLWRWRNVPEDLDDLRGLSPELVSNLLRWMTAEVDDRPVRIEPSQEFFDGGDVVRLVGQVYDESMEPVDGASVLVTVVDPQSNEFNYSMDPIGSGRFTKDLGSLPEGRYRYEARADREGSTVGADSGYFSVGELTLEFRETRADSDLMRQVALRSGGEFATREEATEFVRRIAEAGAGESTTIEEVDDMPLRHVLPLLGLIIVLFGTEWALRKRNGLV